MKLVYIQQNTREWLQFRRSHICASDAPAIMNESPFKDCMKLYDEKIHAYEQPVSYYMQRGKDLEKIALEMFEQETGLVMFPMVGVHEGIDWMAASFDGVSVDRKTILEIKCPGKKDHQTALKGKIPKKYTAQIQHQIYVSGTDFAFYYSFDGEKGIILEVKRDQEYIEIMLAKELEFWNCIQTRTYPKPITLE